MKLTVLFTLICLTGTAVAQTKISGYVLSDTGDTLPGANVYIKDSYDGTSSNASGHFSFVTDETGSKILAASMVGFETYNKEVILDGKNIIINVRLLVMANELNTVTITAGNFETGDIKKTAMLNSLDIATTAGATADILGALKTLPGSQPAAEESGLFVRGGDAHETKTFMDGILVSNMFTSDLPDIAQRGRFSPWMFKSTAFSTGAYSAEYGGALSSTMQLDSKDLPAKTKTDVGIMTVGADATHTQRFKNSSLEIGGAYYNLEPIFSIVKQNTQWIKAPESGQVNAFYKLKTGNNGMLKLYAGYEQGFVGIESGAQQDFTKLTNYRIHSHNLLLNATWHQYLSSTWKINTGIGYGDDQQKIKMGIDQVHQQEKSMHSRVTVTHYYGKLSDVKAGVEYYLLKNDESLNELGHGFANHQSAAFLETNYFITRKIVLRAGVRYEHSDIINQDNLAPRLSFAYKFNNQSQVSAGYGWFYQLPGNEYLFESPVTAFEQATHYVLNYTYQQEKQTFRVEAYYKKYADLVKINNGNPNSIDHSGYGYAKGVDVFWRDNKTITKGEYWISYSFLDTRRNYSYFPTEATPEFAARHVANLVYKYRFTRLNTSIGATYTYASGRTYFNPNNPDFLSDKTKDYHNFSVNLSYLTSIAGHFTVVHASVENIFGINNIFGYRYSADGTQRKAIVPTAPRSIFMGVFITFGDNTFK